MTEVKLKTHWKNWGKQLLGYAFREWRVQTDYFVDLWSHIEYILNLRVKKETFDYFSKEMKEEVIKAKHRRNLGKIYAKTYRMNVGLFFKVWHTVSLNKRVAECNKHFEQEKARFSFIETKSNYAVKRHDAQVDFRNNDVKLRRIMNFLRQYTQRKIFNNLNKRNLEKWLLKGYQK